MANDPLEDAVTTIRGFMVDLEMHLDLAVRDKDPSQIGRAWVRVAEMERLLRAMLPPDAITDDIEKRVEDAATATNLKPPAHAPDADHVRGRQG